MTSLLTWRDRVPRYLLVVAALGSCAGWPGRLQDLSIGVLMSSLMAPTVPLAWATGLDLVWTF